MTIPLLEVYKSIFGNGPFSLIVPLLIILVLFLVIREITTWYWKINKIISLLEEIRDNTRPGAPVMPRNPTLENGGLIVASSLRQPVSGLFALSVLAAVLILGGVALLVMNQILWGLGPFVFAAAILVPIALKERQKRNSALKTESV